MIFTLHPYLDEFYISNGYKFDFGFLKKESESVSVNYSEVDNVRDLKVYFIDIGQGDCIFIELPDGKNMLIDTGEKRNAGKAKIDKYLRDEKGNKVTIDYCVATHPDSDHIGLMPYVYEQYDVLKSYRPYVYSENKSASALPYELNKGIKIKNSSNIYYDYITNVNAEQTYWEFFKDDSDFSNGFTGKDGEIYEYTVNFVMPYADNLNDYQYFTTPNDFSAVIMLEYADRKILFTGDIEYETGKKGAEQSFIREFSTSNPAMVDCDVLKVAHHGSDSSTSPEFLSLVKPEYSVISCGLSNKHRHPLKSTLDNLVNCGSDDTSRKRPDDKSAPGKCDFKINLHILGCAITKEQAAKILSDGRTDKLDFISKSGKNFSARLKLDNDKKIVFDFT